MDDSVISSSTPTTIDERIAFVLSSPNSSEWLKQTLRSALPLDPITVANDLEVLRHLLIPRAMVSCYDPLSENNHR